MAGEERKQKIPIIRTVTPLDHHRLHIGFGSGSVLELNMENRLCTNRYYELNDDAVFRSAVTDGSKIIFDTGTRFKLEIFARETVDRAIRDPDGGMGILRIQPLENGSLRLEMKSGSILMLNMENWLHTIRYSPLKEPEVLQSVSTDGENLFFGDILTIDLEELIMLAISIPPVVSEEES
ncbi:hypothetical protein DesLBE_2061 [Desulfitobacterium sp. LBE]|uniref:hypothetical protein n=1 Tax=Desulfitobacterium sp. LBE TaxID=884086 RepID=UPI00119A4205|nr:hypothetical protein [Desulfitobacterium sp. LBE]TWH57771.1 hypothetical protein DesLBE_2061 [Desulfitobacterium sp. LBE]